MIGIARRPLFGPLFSAFRALVAGGPQPVQTEVPALVAQARAPGCTGFVSLVGAGPGSADLITLRGLARLRAADVVYYDRLADPALLDQARTDAVLVYVGKAPGCHSMPQDRINDLLVQAGQRGLRVVRLKCGDPGVFGRGAEEAAALEAAGLPWEIVPGVTAACAAAASSRSFLTERGKTDRLVLATGHLRHDAPQSWADTARPGTTLACYMGVGQAGAIMQGLIAAGWPRECPVQVISRAQTPQEMVLACTLQGLAEVCRTSPDLNPAILLIRWTAEQDQSAITCGQRQLAF